MGILSFLISIIILIIILKILTFPIKLIIKFVINSIIGGILIAICSFFGIIVVIKWWTILLTGLLGVPGFVIALIITMFI